MKSSKSRDLNISPENYSVFRELLREQLSTDPSFKAAYLTTEFESKLLDPLVADLPDVRRTRAISKWLDCEVLNRETSMRLMFADEEDVLFNRGFFPVSAPDVLFTARRFILETLGSHVPWDELSGSFSGGASTSIRRGVGTIARKYQDGTDITENAITHFLRLTKSTVWYPRDFTIARGNVMFTVPKSSTIDRCACKEPDYNMYAQKAVGDAIRRRLRRVGINLNDQTINNRLAREGSKDGSLATIDLSSASDSVTRQLVLMLLPEEWFYLMDDLRSPITLIDGVEHENVMFSSMGNAFTFELESLIFWALTRACAYHSGIRGKISVYGDDIICPSGLFDIVISTLGFAGFRANAKKSFNSGSFRESCGKHWLGGYDVTPFYVKSVPKDVSDWCHLLNSLRRWADVDGICDPTYFGLWSLFAELVPKPLWGASDLASREQLVAPGRRPIAKCVRKIRTHKRMEDSLGLGAYLHWLDTSKDRLLPTELETSRFTTEGDLVIRRCKGVESSERPVFPEELGA